MDNDNKINELQEAQTHKEVQLFLKDELKNLSIQKRRNTTSKKNTRVQNSTKTVP